MNLQVGACGICCNVCYAFVENGGSCKGCFSGKEAPPLKLKITRCPIIKCAARRSVSYCPKDCRDFPCELFTAKPFPYSHAYLDIIKNIPRSNH
jgi:hypothetical protein